MKLIEAVGVFLLAWPGIMIFCALFLLDSEKLDAATPEDRDSGLKGLAIIAFLMALGLALLVLAR